MAEKFMVVIIGIRPGSDRGAVVQNLIRLFKTDPGRIERLLKKPSVVKTGLDGRRRTEASSSKGGSADKPEKKT